MSLETNSANEIWANRLELIKIACEPGPGYSTVSYSTVSLKSCGLERCHFMQRICTFLSNLSVQLFMWTVILNTSCTNHVFLFSIFFHSLFLSHRLPFLTPRTRLRWLVSDWKIKGLLLACQRIAQNSITHPQVQRGQRKSACLQQKQSNWWPASLGPWDHLDPSGFFKGVLQFSLLYRFHCSGRTLHPHWFGIDPYPNLYR